jgi:hypothetical protein
VRNGVNESGERCDLWVKKEEGQKRKRAKEKEGKKDEHRRLV